MAHRLAPEVEAELDGIWYYIANQSGNFEIADRLIDSITDRFFLLASRPMWADVATGICALA
jgi:toxin ParE1/3/4